MPVTTTYVPLPPFPSPTLSTNTPTQGNVFVWRMEQDRDKTTLIPITHFRAHGQYITRVLLSPDVKHLATCSADHTAKIWEVKDLDEVGFNSPPQQSPPQITVNGHPTPANTNPDGSSTSTTPSHPSASHNLDPNSFSNASAPFHTPPGHNEQTPNSGDAQAQAVPFRLESTLQGHQRWVWDCAFSADSAYLVTACSDHYARLWELASEQIIRQYNGHHRGAVCVALNDYSEAR